MFNNTICYCLIYLFKRPNISGGGLLISHSSSPAYLYHHHSQSCVCLLPVLRCFVCEALASAVTVAAFSVDGETITYFTRNRCVMAILHSFPIISIIIII